MTNKDDVNLLTFIQTTNETFQTWKPLTIKVFVYS